MEPVDQNLGTHNHLPHFLFPLNNKKNLLLAVFACSLKKKKENKKKQQLETATGSFSAKAAEEHEVMVSVLKKYTSHIHCWDNGR